MNEFFKPQPKPPRIKYEGKEYTAFRKKVATSANERCECCDCPAPRLLPEGGFDEYRCGHVSHIISRGAGGSDTLENTKWYCFKCHRAGHDGK